MIEVILLLTAVQVYLELRLCKPGSWMHRMNRKSPIFGLLVSIVISILCAAAFGAAGMIVLVSGLLSTVITQVYYSLPDQLYNDIQKRKGEVHDWFMACRDEWYEQFVTLFKFTRMVVKVAFLPVSVVFKTLAWLNAKAEQRA